MFKIVSYLRTSSFRTLYINAFKTEATLTRGLSTFTRLRLGNAAATKYALPVDFSPSTYHEQGIISRTMHMGQWNYLGKHLPTNERILQARGNRVCCDCTSESVTQINTLNAAVYCTPCKDIHKSLGIRSDFVPLDEAAKLSFDEIEFCSRMGNEEVNNIYEALLKVVGYRKPDCASSLEDISQFIHQKYIQCAFSVACCDPDGTKNVLNYISEIRSRGTAIPNMKQSAASETPSIPSYQTMLDSAFGEQYLIVSKGKGRH